MDLDRQSIEKRDFPISRRGYDPAAVDVHLRALATEIEELQHVASSRGGESLASTASTQVQSILEAAEATAADIQRQASENSQRVTDQADHDAQKTRNDAVARAQEHVAVVSQATATLLERVESMDSEVSSLVDSLRNGANQLSTDLASLQSNMGELYAGASGQASSVSQQAPSDAQPLAQAPLEQSDRSAEQIANRPGQAIPTPALDTQPTGSSSLPKDEQPSALTATSTPAGENDLDGARLIALNMALNGESRERADRYLAEHFTLTDRQKLLDDVYAAIEG